MLCGLPHIFPRLLFIHFFSGTILLFLFNFYTRSLWYFLLFSKWMILFRSFLWSHWWPVLVILLFGLLQIFDSLSKWNLTTFSWVNVAQVSCKGILRLTISEPSIATLPISPLFDCHTKSLWRLSIVFKWTVSSITSFWVIDDVLSKLCCGTVTRFYHFLSGTVPFFLRNYSIRSQNIFLLFPSGHLIYFFVLSLTIQLSFVWKPYKFYVRHIHCPQRDCQ